LTCTSVAKAPQDEVCSMPIAAMQT
jgi:hypothetical protein